ncbi:pentapeptide repeat-containing protein [Bacillus horti]|uniref:Uncharacterized protein YjbI with pentapeptide repeats n=1 Tax=Caldalkalibacillus horti TaxID=77523 RepID=A0ABT9W4V4_9BACI|nr:pentapeptide repeat-containing protein [Bacillus horti]MDQ0168269.1 uncharacterized protein YjbI with pentapeptide repeats [Bacillus horti]
MRKKKHSIQEPDLPYELLPIALESEHISSHAYIENGIIENIATQLRADHVGFSELYLKSVQLQGSQLNASNWTDVIFEKCDLSNVKFNRAQFNRVRFVDCKMVGTDFDEAVFADVQFVQCQGQLSTWSVSTCKDMSFEDCQLKSASFFEAVFERIQFGKSYIDDVQFTGTSLADVDLSLCHFDSIHASAGDLVGSVISPEQAVAFVQAFGVKVKQ